MVAAAVGVGIAAVGVAAALVLAPNDRSPGAATTDPTGSTDSTVPAGQTVAIPSTQLWTDTEVDCRTGEVLDISATGTVVYDESTAASAVDPDGLTDPGLHQYNVAGLPDANTVALIGSINQEQPFFVVGKGTTYECPDDGSLFLGINDVGVDNNSGEFTATITPSSEASGGTSSTGRTVEIPSTELWTDTHVECTTGEVLDISASGTVLHDNTRLTSAVDADGLTDPVFHQYNVPGLPDANTVALIGSIDQQQPYFVVGRGTTYECPGDGTVFLGINDVGVQNNSGAFVATIKRQTA